MVSQAGYGPGNPTSYIKVCGPWYGSETCGSQWPFVRSARQSVLDGDAMLLLYHWCRPYIRALCMIWHVRANYPGIPAYKSFHVSCIQFFFVYCWALLNFLLWGIQDKSIFCLKRLLLHWADTNMLGPVAGEGQNFLRARANPTGWSQDWI